MFGLNLGRHSLSGSFPALLLFIFLCLSLLWGLSFATFWDDPLLRPLNGLFWLKEAEKEISQGNDGRALKIVQYAASICGPVSPSRLNIAELLIELNQTDLALTELKFVFETDENLRKTAVFLAKSILGENGGLSLVDKGKKSSLSAFLQLAIDQKWTEEAKTIWSLGTESGKILFDSELSKKYVNYLIGMGELKEAKGIWNRLMGSTTLVWNGDFEEGFQNWGFGWKFHPRSSFLKIKQDNQLSFSKKSSLLIEFIGLDPNHDHVLLEQLLVIEPKKTYLISAAVKAEDISSSSGIVVDLYDKDNDQVLGSTDPLALNKKWSVAETKVKVPKTTGTSYLRIKWKESPEWEIPLYGKVWIDKVQFEEIIPEEKDPSSPDNEDSGEDQQEGEDSFENDSQENPSGSTSS
ncbi:carbohydrate binding domain-containing protein [Methylacidiphilum caldifontis]|uniref:CBM-cenC domain-containing protein n=1 Tax=Methylacidiphilum caldifontis TaxID=2795386 RepID=A0A4Y8P7V2_9BACT|nr:carbohydrate binding domain-containing protein [Methylacidiphilum caldifontis]TFE66573.1 hypothetical protein A7Q10_02015 [Methylacidiphilum caldifontis]